MTLTLLIAGLTAAPVVSQAGWFDKLKEYFPQPAEQTEPSSPSGGATSLIPGLPLTQAEIVAGLKDALARGAESAVARLGRQDGYYGNPVIKVPLPPAVNKTTGFLRKIGQDGLVDSFELSLNRAAEQAAAEATPVFLSAIKNMSIEDGLKILNGPDNAATDYLRKSAGAELQQRMRPIVTQATARVGVTNYYKQIMDRGASLLSFALQDKPQDLDGYVTDKAVDGLFVMIAEEEKRIRKDPISRTTDLLKRVFGHIGK